MEERGAAAVEAGSSAGSYAVELLRRLIRIDTTNPPGNERQAQELLASELGEAGFDCELLGVEPERPNLVARLRGEGEGPTLCLLGHVDTVPADADEWSRDPWGGDLAKGQVWGRGAQDMKDQVAAEVATAISLARSGWRPRGELLVVTTADEEMGAHLGAKWLCEEHPEKVRSDLVVNEGGGPSFVLDGRRLYTLCVGEKGVFRFKLRARGRAGHASVPALGENALLKLAPLIGRLADQPDPEATPEGLEFLGAVLGETVTDDGLADALDRVGELDPLLAAFVAEPMLRVTLSPTRAWASEKDNVIPSRAEVLVDCRVPPEMDEPVVRERVEGVLSDDGSGEFEIEFTENAVGNRSPSGTPFWRLIEETMEELDPGAGLVPIVMAGFSDSHWFRKAFGAATVYGFCPQRGMSLAEVGPLVHGADERIEASDVEFASNFYQRLCKRVLGG
jgi:acetylornithine deacetylase/succinyl-diaminopimelate desuccinylase-like protein